MDEKGKHKYPHQDNYMESMKSFDEEENEKLKSQLQSAREVIEFYGDPFNWQSRSGKIGVGGVWADGGECDHPMKVCSGAKARDWISQNPKDES